MTGRPKGRMADDAIQTCASCFAKVMERGSDTVGWKGIQLTDEPTILSWYCPREVCQQVLHFAFNARVREMRIARGMDPNPPPNAALRGKTRRSPVAMGDEGAGHTMGVPPGGFASTEVTPVTEEES